MYTGNHNSEQSYHTDMHMVHRCMYNSTKLTYKKSHIHSNMAHSYMSKHGVVN